MAIPAASSTRIPQPANQIVPKSALAPETRYAGGVTDGQSPNGGRPFSFRDLIDIVNPLQHIPVVSTLYRHITGDEISNFSRVAGGALFGGLGGILVGGINAISHEENGKDIGQGLLAKFLGDEQDTQTVSNKTPEKETIQTASVSGSSTPSVASHGSGQGQADIPVIEVRPQQHSAAQPASKEDHTAQHALPAERPLKALRDLSSVADQPFTLSDQQLKDPHNKDAIQRAMMDALLKMQELEDKGSTASSVE
jgi:hypothetical protein